MNSKELLEQANQRVVTMNKVMRELEDFEGVVGAAQEKDSEIAFYEYGIGTTSLRVLSDDMKQELKIIVIKAITDAQSEKTAELERLLGARKPAILNPDFEQAVKEMEQH